MGTRNNKRTPKTVCLGLMVGAVLWCASIAAWTDPGPALSLTEAEAVDKEGHTADALAAYLRLEQAGLDPEPRKQVLERIHVLVAELRDQGSRIDPAEFARLREPLVAAADRRLFPAAMLLGERLRALGESEAAFAVFLAAARRGFPPAQIQVGLMYSNGDGVEKNLAEASRWLRPANVKGDPVGKVLLAECFLFGKGVTRNREQAVILLREAVTMDNPGRALDLLGSCYHKGWGVDQDAAEAARLYREACGHNFYNGCANLAALTMRGDGLPADPEAAVALLRDGVADGNPRCMYFYAAAFWSGMGVLRDPAAAEKWFRRAAMQGHAEAIAWCEQHQVAIDAK